MKKNNLSEKRKYPRLEKQLPVKIAVNGYDFVTNTRNISCLGAYCNVNKYIPPFTKVAIKMALPAFAKNRTGDVDIKCHGVIVRTDDEENGGFNIAIFFNKIVDSQRQKISKYISHFLPETSTPDRI